MIHCQRLLLLMLFVLLLDFLLCPVCLKSFTCCVALFVSFVIFLRRVAVQTAVYSVFLLSFLSIVLMDCLEAASSSPTILVSDTECAEF